MTPYPTLEAHADDKNLIILQSLICLLREKNILSRADIEDLCATVQARAANAESDALPCATKSAQAAASEIAQIGSYVGQRYGGKHRRAN
jgi:hypothetical protein